jgi:hypothetical protein
MASKLQIINLALSHLGELNVDEITQDPKPAKVVKAIDHFDEALDTACSRAPWLCCLERRTITRTPSPTEDPVNGVAGDFKFPYVFTLPVETLRVWYVDDRRQSFAWERSRVIQGKFVGRPIIRATDAGPLNVAITRRTIPELLTPLLCEALGLDLAARLAGPIQSDAAKAAQLAKRADEAYARAMGAEAGEHGGDEPLLISHLAEARLGVGGAIGGVSSSWPWP